MTAGYAKRLESVSVKGLNGSGTLEFTGTAKHGAGKRYVSIELLPATLLELADALVCCPGAIDSPGHAVWHWENSARARPCPDSKTEAERPKDKRKKDALALVNAERGAILYFIEQKLKQIVSRCTTCGRELPRDGKPRRCQPIAGGTCHPGSTFAAGFLQGIYDAIEAGDHAKP